MEYPGPPGREYSMDSRCFYLNGKPVLPLMGEMQFSRVDRSCWKEILLKMKGAGLNAAASYVFWNHHEELEGRFDWTGQRDLRAFVELCGSLDLKVFLRVGPWVHGEARYGGFPDWLMKKWWIPKRRFNRSFLRYTDRFFDQILNQVSGLDYEKGGPVIGLQVENEYRIRGPRSVNYLMHLKRKFTEGGFHLPVYALTAWPPAPSGLYPREDFVPFQGDYAASPWEKAGKKLDRSGSYRFQTKRNLEGIGTDILKKAGKRRENEAEGEAFPFCQIELGLGNQVTHHRRPWFSELDSFLMSFVKLGSGVNWLGYYVFAGGTNPQGTLTSLEENRETGYPNDYPRKSYDFHAPVGEWGQLKTGYWRVKGLHYGIRDYQEYLAPAVSQVCGEDSELNWAFRSDGERGFLFVSHYNRYDSQYKIRPLEDLQFQITGRRGAVTIPSEPVTIEPGDYFFWPLGIPYGRACLDYGTAQPLCIRRLESRTHCFFQVSGSVPPEFLLSGAENLKLFSRDWAREEAAGRGDRIRYTGNPADPGMTAEFEFSDSSGRVFRMTVLSDRMGKSFWRDGASGRVLICDQEVLMEEGGVTILSDRRDPAVLEYDFDRCGFTEAHPAAAGPALAVQPLSVSGYNPLASAPLCTAIPGKPFSFSFSWDDPGDISAGRLYLAGSGKLRLSLNGRKVRLPGSPEKGVTADIRRYLKRGENLLLAAPAGGREVCLRAGVEADSANTRRFFFTPGPDRKDSAGGYLSGGRSATSDTPLPVLNQPGSWLLEADPAFPGGIENLFLNITYDGDRAELRIGGVLAADHYNQGYPWTVGLKSFRDLLIRSEGQMVLSIKPLKNGKRVSVETPGDGTDLGAVKLKKAELTARYRFNL